MSFGLGSFAGGVAQGIGAGMQLSMAKQEADRRQAEHEEKVRERQSMRDYATEMGKNAERIGKAEDVYSVPGMTDGFSTTDKDAADALAGMATDAAKPTTYTDGTTTNPAAAGVPAPASPVAPQKTSRSYTQSDFDLDRLKLAGRLGLGEQADKAAAMVLANRQSEAIRKAAMAGEFTQIGREYGVIKADQHIVGATNPQTGKYHMAVANADGTLATDPAGRPLGRIFDNQEHAVASIAAMADPKTLANMYMSGAKNESAMERLITANLLRGDKGYGANGAGGASGGKQAKEDKNPYGWLGIEDFEKIYPKDVEGTKAGMADAYELYRTLLAQNGNTLGASDEGNARALSIAMRFGSGQYKPSAEMMPDGIWSAQIQHGAAKFNLQQGIDPVGNHGINALAAPPREKVVQMDRQWLESLGRSEEGRDIYRQATKLAFDDAAFMQAGMAVRQGLGSTAARMTWAAADKLRRLRNDAPDKPAQATPQEEKKSLINFTPTPGAAKVGRNSDNFNFFR